MKALPRSRHAPGSDAMGRLHTISTGASSPSVATAVRKSGYSSLWRRASSVDEQSREVDYRNAPAISVAAEVRPQMVEMTASQTATLLPRLSSTLTNTGSAGTALFESDPGSADVA